MSDITAVRFTLAVPDLAVSTDYYTNVLGLTIDFTAPGWTFLSRGSFRVMLGECSDATPPAALGDHSWYGYITVTDAAALCAGVGVKRTTLFLGMAGQVGAGTLAATTPAAATLDYRVDYDISTDAYFPFWPDTPDARAALFTTRPLAAAATIEGYSIVSIKAAADAVEGDMFAYLEDVDPSGKAVVLAQGRLAGSHRRLAKPPYANLDLPYHSGLQRDAAPLVPGQPVTLTFELSPRSYVVQSQHRLRVAIAGADPRQRNLADIKSGLTKRWRLYGGAAASRIDIPFTTTVQFEADDK